MQRSFPEYRFRPVLNASHNWLPSAPVMPHITMRSSRSWGEPRVRLGLAMLIGSSSNN